MNGAGLPKSVRTLQSPEIVEPVKPASVYELRMQLGSGDGVRPEHGNPLRPLKPMVAVADVTDDGEVVVPPHALASTTHALKITLARRRLTKHL
jgi:hypothetical protein